MSCLERLDSSYRAVGAAGRAQRAPRAHGRLARGEELELVRDLGSAHHRTRTMVCQRPRHTPWLVRDLGSTPHTPHARVCVCRPRRSSTTVTPHSRGTLVVWCCEEEEEEAEEAEEAIDLRTQEEERSSLCVSA